MANTEEFPALLAATLPEGQSLGLDSIELAVDRLSTGMRDLVSLDVGARRLHLSLHLSGAFCTIWCVCCVS